MIKIRMERWGIKAGGNGFTAPEIAGAHLIGRVYGHPRKDDGDLVKTSHLVTFTGREAHTESGSHYELGAMHPEFAAHLRTIREGGQELCLGVSIDELLMQRAPT